MKGEITLKILEALEDAAVDAADGVGVFLSAGYGASYRHIQYEMSKRRGEREVRVAKERERLAERQRCVNLLCALKRDGLVDVSGDQKKKKWTLTLKGVWKLRLLRKRAEEAPLPKTAYTRRPAARFVIVVFDIPEHERRKRRWLRGVLGNLGFRMLQKSVWVGKVNVPEEFIDDLRKLRLMSFVEIFEISKTGSLRQLV